MKKKRHLRAFSKTLKLISLTMAVSFYSATAFSDDGFDQFRIKDSDFPARNPSKEALGKLLMSDKILSGNKNISCSSCHHAFAATADGLSLPIGEGGAGFGVTRDPGTVGKDINAIKQRVPRHAPHLFNLGAKEFTKMFWDAKVQADPTKANGFINPAGTLLPNGFDSALAVNAVFPIGSANEMAGHAGENEVADAGAKKDFKTIWAIYEERIRAISEYVDLFKEAYPTQIKSANDITIVHVGNAIAAFEAAAWRCTDAPFDRYLKDPVNTIVSNDIKEGASLFYGKAKCSACHSGPFQTDQDFHSIALPQIGPGKGNNQTGYKDGLDDFGRELVTANPADRFKFKTPSLRQVGLTAPYGHDGAYSTLEDMIRHYNNPNAYLTDEQKAKLVMTDRADLVAKDFVVNDDPARIAAIAASLDEKSKGINLTEDEIKKVATFLREGLTDYSCLDLRRDVPKRVPSGLPIYD